MTDIHKNDEASGAPAFGGPTRVQTATHKKETVSMTTAELGGKLLPGVFMDCTRQRRILSPSPRLRATGLTHLDSAIGGGIGTGEMCLLTAFSGGGMTTMMQNFMMEAANREYHSLTVSLKLPRRHLRESAIMMAAHIDPTDTYVRGRYSDAEHARISGVGNSGLLEKLTIADMSDGQATPAAIVRRVETWLAMLEKRGLRHRAGFVGIDSATFIDVSEYSKATYATDHRPEIITRAVHTLKRDIANRLGMRLLITYPAKAYAYGLEYLGFHHAPDGFETADLCVGIAPEKIEKSRLHTDPPLLKGNRNSVGKHLVVSLFKNRVGDTNVFRCYRAPTLHVYNRHAEYADTLEAISEGRFRPGA